ncbi:MAG: hypothetical protein ORN85_06240 [Sediminibacterium sp.]|nr:hypothetical protein [Sediminibacterium sp.]
MKQRTFIIAVVSLMSLLMIKRAKQLIIDGKLDKETIFFTIIEACFLIWGILVLKNTSNQNKK